MTKPAEIARMIETAGSTFGAVDILVNNAGIQHVAPVDEFPTDRWDAIIAINLSAAFHTTRAALPAMKARGWGTHCQRGLRPRSWSPHRSSRPMSRRSTGSWVLPGRWPSRPRRMESPATRSARGYVKTALVEGQIPDLARARGVAEEDVVRDVMLAAQPTRRFVGVEEIGALTVFLCSDSARSITGAALPIDGGWTAQ